MADDAPARTDLDEAERWARNVARNVTTYTAQSWTEYVRCVALVGEIDRLGQPTPDDLAELERLRAALAEHERLDIEQPRDLMHRQLEENARLALKRQVEIERLRELQRFAEARKERDAVRLAERDAEIARLRAAWAPEVVARMFHEAYERLAPEYGYRTREASARPWGEVPEQNRALMVATVGEVLRALAAAPAPTERRTLTDDEYRRAVELCERTIDAARSSDGGPTAAGHFLGKLRDLLDSLAAPAPTEDEET